jgi:hypothetical protein
MLMTQTLNKEIEDKHVRYIGSKPKVAEEEEEKGKMSPSKKFKQNMNASEYN